MPLYLTDAAGLVDATPPEFSEAVEEDADPPAAVVAATLEEFTADPVRALLVNTQTRTPVTDQVEQGRPGRGSAGRRGGGDAARRNHRLRRMDQAASSTPWARRSIGPEPHT